MVRLLSIFLALVASVHGFIHLMGFAAYWPLATIDGLPYKTALLNGRLELGAGGMRLFSLLWLLAALAFLVSATALGAGQVLLGAGHARRCPALADAVHSGLGGGIPRVAG